MSLLFIQTTNIFCRSQKHYYNHKTNSLIRIFFFYAQLQVERLNIAKIYTQIAKMIRICFQWEKKLIKQAEAKFRK